MYGEMFYWFLNMSITATLTGICILCLRRIKRLPRRLVFFLWIIPYLRMWIPIGPASNYGLMPLLSRISTKTVVVYKETIEITAMNSVGGAKSYFPVTYKINLLEDIFRIGAFVWLGVAVVFLITGSILYAVTKREMRDVVPLQDNIYLLEKVQSPAVYGVIKPKIILPKAYKDRDLSLILLHENEHIGRRDNFWRGIAFVTAALHWFNPFVWLFLKCFLSDMELSCDERVLCRCGEKKKKEYASLLVDCIASKNIFASEFGGAKIRTRIDNILSYKKVSALSVVCFVGLAVIIAYALLANAR